MKIYRKAKGYLSFHKFHLSESLLKAADLHNCKTHCQRCVAKPGYPRKLKECSKRSCIISCWLKHAALSIKLIPPTSKTKAKLFPVPCSAQSKIDMKPAQVWARHSISLFLVLCLHLEGNTEALGDTSFLPVLLKLSRFLLVCFFFLTIPCSAVKQGWGFPLCHTMSVLPSRNWEFAYLSGLKKKFRHFAPLRRSRDNFTELKDAPVQSTPNFQTSMEGCPQPTQNDTSVNTEPLCALLSPGDCVILHLCIPLASISDGWWKLIHVMFINLVKEMDYGSKTLNIPQKVKSSLLSPHPWGMLPVQTG